MNQPSMLDVNPAERRDEDFYATPSYQTRALLARLPLLAGCRVFEPCCGDGAIVRELPPAVDVLTNDVVVRPPVVPEFLLDACRAESWSMFAGAGGPIDVVVTNPPFNEAFEIAAHALQAARVGVALLLRLSWLEPTDERGYWLKWNPPTRLVVLPRHDYRGNGKTDSVTSAWCIWSVLPGWVAPGLEIVTKDERDALIAAERLSR